MTADPSRFLYIGTYTAPEQHGNAEGIYVYTMDQVTGALARVRAVPSMANPSFLALDHQRRNLFAVNEIEQYNGEAGGAVSAFGLDAATGDLTFLNAQPTLGTIPCHLCVDPTGRYVLSANYGSGNLAVHPIGLDGRLGAATDIVQHSGSGPNLRQQGPHMHMILFDLMGMYALAVDLGGDVTLIYRLDTATGTLVRHDIATATGASVQSAGTAHPGAGPRHLAFHPNGRFAYVINELDGTMAVFMYNGNTGVLQPTQTVSTLPDGYNGRRSCAEIAVHPSGHFVYGSNRGHDSIAIFTIDEKTGNVTARGHTLTQGKEPRNFTIDPTGRFLLVANQDTDTVVTFHIDLFTGDLMPTGHIAEVPAPACLLFG